MPESLGNLVDRLSITNHKIFVVQDWVHDAAEMDPEVFSSQTHEEIQGQLKKLKALNLERNRLMTQVDQCLADSVASGKAVVDSRIKIV